MRTEQIQILPLFGYGNFGSNCTVIGTNNSSFILDLGMSFTDQGSKYYEKIMRGTRAKNLKPTFILLTHAHADHVSFILDSNFKRLGLPIYCSSFSRDFLNKRVKGLDIHVVSELEEFTIQQFTIKPILIQHSCDGTYAFQISTLEGSRITIIPDHKLETASIIKKFKPSPDILLIESTNSTENTRIDSEKVVLERIENEYDLASIGANNIYITTFSLCTRRIMKVVEIAKRESRTLIVAGKSIQYTLKILLDNKQVEYDKIIFLKRSISVLEQVKKANNLMILCSGHQGEPNAALPLLIEAKSITSNDLILFLSKQIPDPEAIINRGSLLSKIAANKIRFIDNIHCSGHSAIPELTYTLKEIAAKMVIPMHGDAKNLGGLVDIINKNKIPSKVRILVNNQYIRLKITL